MDDTEIKAARSQGSVRKIVLTSLIICVGICAFVVYLDPAVLRSPIRVLIMGCVIVGVPLINGLYLSRRRAKVGRETAQRRNAQV
jgi:hypothetical protein